MIAVIFEVEPRPAATMRYFELAAAMRAELEAVDGFISVERFESLAQAGRYLSLSFWRDESAVRDWRCNDRHRRSQQAGRDDVFDVYRLRVASVVRDYGLLDRERAPADSCIALI